MHFQIVLVFFVSVLAVSSAADRFPLSLVHINDLHARYEPTDISGGTCNGNGCIGGYARTVYTVKRLLEENADFNPIFLNAGDNFQGTLWYNIGRWNVTSQFLNMLPADVMTLGNHEFDNGVEGCVPFLETIDTPIVVANMNASGEPTMQGKFEKSIIIERSGRKIGIIGLLLETVYDLANTGNLKFDNEVETLIEESANLKAQGADIIIALTHCGYDLDQQIAQNASGAVDVIVGSHSHTFLYTGPLPENFPFTYSGGDYPTIVEDSSGHKVLIVQASAYARFVGNIRVYFDDKGEVIDWEGAPIFMSADVPEDEDVKAAMVPWKEIIDQEGVAIVGSSRVTLEKERCYNEECSLGNFYTDALVHSFLNEWPYSSEQWTDVPIAVINPGGLRVALFAGNLTYSHIVTMSPFENDLVAFDITGEQLISALEVGAKNSMLQVSGLKVTYDMSQPTGKTVVDVKVRCAKCPYPKYEPIVMDKYYRVATVSFLADGGDGFYQFRDGINRKTSIKDIDALVNYLKSISPVTTGEEQHLTVVKSLSEMRPFITERGNEVISVSRVNLPLDNCYSGECNLGNIVTDAMLHSFLGLTPYTNVNWAEVSIAVISGNDMYTSLGKGDITRSQIYNLLPYETTLVSFELSAKHLREALELSVSEFDLAKNITSSRSLLQVSGLKIVYNLTAPVYHRIVNIKVRCSACALPVYEEFDINRNYGIISTRYLANGIIFQKKFNTKFYSSDFQSVLNYLNNTQPITKGIENRIT